MIEVHHKMSIQRVKACAGVAVEKGLGAEGRFCARSILALRKISAMLSQKCGALSTPVYNRPNGGFYGQGYALWRTPAFQIVKRLKTERIQIHYEANSFYRCRNRYRYSL